MNEHINDAWKEFGNIEITHSIIHYLFAIDFLVKNKGYCRAVDIVNNLGITAGSCSISIKNLIKKDLIIEDENKFIKLSDKGEYITKKAIYKRNILNDFFISIGLNKDTAQSEACKIEHLLLDEVVEKIKDFRK
ncbi:metal-dependent transcriptional regulator [Candidatus Gracilibacteria bacterium]|nr:metal-dependent transcriptional regulator [Candidatus Gracilibacteria bacterium]